MELGLTQEEAAHRIRMATRHYQKLESAQLNVTLRTLVRVADAFQLEVKELLS
jgi:transcriptional regulator with XRE-family HTH domain